MVMLASSVVKLASMMAIEHCILATMVNRLVMMASILVMLANRLVI